MEIALKNIGYNVQTRAIFASGSIAK